MAYVPLTDVWARNGLAAVVFASLVDAGFHPVTECDLYGWMHYFKWPLGSERPLTIWVPAEERGDAERFLSAAPEADAPAEGGLDAGGFWGVLRAATVAVFMVWLFLLVFAGM